VRLTRRHALRLWPLGLGLILLAGLWLGPLPAMSRTAFSAHMLLHLGIVALAAPLLAAGLIRAGVRLDGLQPPMRWTMLASMVELMVVWGWHAPLLHAATARHVPVFVLQQTSFLAAGLALWLLGFAPRSKEAAAAGVIAFLMTVMHMTLLGTLLTFTPRLLYDPELCLGAFGFRPLEDQQFGGMLMATVGGFAYMLGGIVLALRLLEGMRPRT
jgi:putative membrane protein